MKSVTKAKQTKALAPPPKREKSALVEEASRRYQEMLDSGEDKEFTAIVKEHEVQKALGRRVESAKGAGLERR
jgi:hypothetical protein